MSEWLEKHIDQVRHLLRHSRFSRHECPGSKLTLEDYYDQRYHALAESYVVDEPGLPRGVSEHWRVDTCLNEKVSSFEAKEGHCYAAVRLTMSEIREVLDKGGDLPSVVNFHSAYTSPSGEKLESIFQVLITEDPD